MLSRSDSGTCPFEELLAAELHGGAETLAWLIQHRNENPYPLRHHVTNIFRIGSDGEVTKVRFYLYVNQITNNIPFDVSSGVVDVGIRRGDHGMVFTSMSVVLDAEDSIPFAEHSAKNSAVAAREQAVRRPKPGDIFAGGVAVITGAGAGIGAGLGPTCQRARHDGRARRCRRRRRGRAP